MTGVRSDTLQARFWAKVSREAPLKCWEWTARKDRKGYGLIATDRGTARAHRIAWRLKNGSIPPGKIICHRCDNPSCVNPAHLFIGTHLDNARDRNSKGRAWQQRVTHCPQGHEYTPENTYTGNRNVRACRACNRIRAREKRARNGPKPRVLATHCTRGHEYTPENTYVWKGHRACIECRRKRELEYYHEARSLGFESRQARALLTEKANG